MHIGISPRFIKHIFDWYSHLPRKYLKYHLVWCSGFSKIGVLGDPKTYLFERRRKRECNLICTCQDTFSTSSSFLYMNTFHSTGLYYRQFQWCFPPSFVVIGHNNIFLYQLNLSTFFSFMRWQSGSNTFSNKTIFVKNILAGVVWENWKNRNPMSIWNGSSRVGWLLCCILVEFSSQHSLVSIWKSTEMRSLPTVLLIVIGQWKTKRNNLFATSFASPLGLCAVWPLLLCIQLFDPEWYYFFFHVISVHKIK